MTRHEPTRSTGGTARENEHERPRATSGDEVGAAAVDALPGVVVDVSHGQAVLHAPREGWRGLAEWLRDEQGFELCVDLCGVDHLLNVARRVPEGVTPHRFEVVANFLSLSGIRRVRAVAQVPGPTPEAPTPRIDSLVPVYPGVEFAERETYDLFGIAFEGHPDLTRIFLPDDWEGHPLRKDDSSAKVPVQFRGAPPPR